MITSLSEEKFRDKVFGCWMGKNSGGTLGAPLETAYGKDEPFDVWWYPKLEAGGIPNDDLELQLIWLMALEEKGPVLDAQVLADYWMDYVGYNWDEYGFHKSNLRFGLRPPVSSVHNNWFKDCMGCPIRSEIWACVAPGHPRLAARYAYEDAILDHAGGEGVYGELFNVAIQASAFVLDDPKTLIEIGLSYVPESSLTHRAVSAALAAVEAGVDWKEARRRVLQAVPHYNSQFAPLNMAFQVIGWLYGTDFGDAICKAVNCGYDTDCTGATLGAYLGILQGNQALPQKWMEPLGTVIATNASWGGLRNLDRAPRPIPCDCVELTDRTLVVAERVMRHHGLSLSKISNDPADLKADAGVKELWKKDPWTMGFRPGSVEVDLRYPGTAALAQGQSRSISARIRNPHGAAIQLKAELRGNRALQVEGGEKWVGLAPGSELELSWKITANGPLRPSERLDLALSADQRPAILSVPVVWVAAVRWLLLENFPVAGKGEDRELFDTCWLPEKPTGGLLGAESRGAGWTVVDGGDNALPFTQPLSGAGVSYARSFCLSPVARRIRLGVPTNIPVKVWLNGKLESECFVYRPYRPNYGGPYDGKEAAYVDCELKSGWNEIFIKLVRGNDVLLPASAGMEAALLLTDPADHRAGLTDQVRSRLPWENFP